jgi:hypothetical protein
MLVDVLRPKRLSAGGGIPRKRNRGSVCTRANDIAERFLSFTSPSVRGVASVLAVDRRLRYGGLAKFGWLCALRAGSVASQLHSGKLRPNTRLHLPWELFSSIDVKVLACQNLSRCPIAGAGDGGECPEPRCSIPGSIWEVPRWVFSGSGALQNQ